MGVPLIICSPCNTFPHVLTVQRHSICMPVLPCMQQWLYCMFSINCGHVHLLYQYISWCRFGAEELFSNIRIHYPQACVILAILHAILLQQHCYQDSECCKCTLTCRCNKILVLLHQRDGLSKKRMALNRITYMLHQTTCLAEPDCHTKSGRDARRSPRAQDPALISQGQGHPLAARHSRESIRHQTSRGGFSSHFRTLVSVGLLPFSYFGFRTSAFSTCPKNFAALTHRNSMAYQNQLNMQETPDSLPAFCVTVWLRETTRQVAIFRSHSIQQLKYLSTMA